MIQSAPSPGLDPALASYVMDVQRSDWSELLALFSPPVPRSGSVVIASLFGDVFLEAGEGEILWLDAQMQKFESVAENRAAFAERLKADHAVLLKTALVDVLVAREMRLAPGALYGLKQPVSEGGRWHPDNIGAAPVAEAFAYWGDQFRRAYAVANASAPALIRGGVRPEKQTKKKGWFN